MYLESARNDLVVETCEQLMALAAWAEQDHEQVVTAHVMLATALSQQAALDESRSQLVSKDLNPTLQNQNFLKFDIFVWNK